LIFITAKLQVRPEDAEAWPEITRTFTEATRAEPGCLWFDWSRSLDDPTEYVLIEAFADGKAGAAHVGSAHFAAARRDLPPHLVGIAFRGRYKGQRQKWFALRFTGQDADIDLTAHEPEFSAFQWVSPEALPDLIVPFKRKTYRQVLAALGPLAKRK
jgi:quinol monooxygenase YgiN